MGIVNASCTALGPMSALEIRVRGTLEPHTARLEYKTLSPQPLVETALGVGGK